METQSKKHSSESGVIMIEATIYFPIVIFLVIALIYMGMVKYQESVLTFQVQKLAVMGGRQVAYPGYEEFWSDGSIDSGAVDFKKSSSFGSSMEAYYEAHSHHLYNEWRFDYGNEQAELKNTLEDILSQRSFLTGITTEANVEIGNYVIGKRISVTASYGLESPRFLEIIGVPLNLKMTTYVTQSAANPTELVRDIDLAGDLINFLLERFGVKDRVDDFLKKVEDIKNKIL